MQFFESAEFWFSFHIVVVGFFLYIFKMTTNQKNNLLNENRKLKEQQNNKDNTPDDKNELLKILTHDLKNPISALKGSAMLIQSDPADVESNSELAKMIEEAADEVTERLGQFLDMQEIDDVKYELNKSEVDVHKLLEKIIEINKPQAQAKKQSIDFNKKEDNCYVIKADEQKLIAAVDNIVNNAIKYSPLSKNINVNLERKNGKVLIEVKDEGPGFSDEDLKKAFGKFKRLSARPTGGELSSGLGLFIVKRIVELHDGKVWINSQKGIGSSFFIEV